MKKLLPIILVFVFLSCQKAQRDEDTATNSAQDVSLAQAIYSDAYKLMRTAALASPGISNSDTSINSLFGCDEITVDTLSDPKTIVIDFKYLGCEGLGEVRGGRLEASFYGKFPVTNSAVDINFSNYYFNDYEVRGQIRAIYKEPNSSGNPINTFYVTNGWIGESASMTWTASQNWETMPIENGELKFVATGSSNGVNMKGNVFFAEILNGLTLSDKCIAVETGSQDLEVINLSNRTVIYENTSCVNQGVAVVNGSRIPFTY